MYINNSLIKYRICNGTIRIIIDINLIDQSVRVTFSVKESNILTTLKLMDVIVNKLNFLYRTALPQLYIKYRVSLYQYQEIFLRIYIDKNLMI